jgi:hypothetical protein
VRAGGDVIGLDQVLGMASSIGDVTVIEASRGELGWDAGWTVRVRGEREYQISFSVEGKGATLDIACRDAIYKLERAAEEAGG